MTPYICSRRYEVAGESFDGIEFRAPTFQDYRQIGPAYEVQRGVVIIDRAAIFAYVDRLVVRPSAGALQVLDLEDVMGLEDHILDFFIKARMSRASRMSSSSGSAGAPAMSIG